MRAQYGLLAAVGKESSGQQQQSQQQQAQEPTWGLGLAVSADRKPYRSFDHKVQPLPLVTYENRWISIMGPGGFDTPDAGLYSVTADPDPAAPVHLSNLLVANFRSAIDGLSRVVSSPSSST